MIKIFEFPKDMKLIQIHDHDGENGTTFILVPADMNLKDIERELPFSSYVGRMSSPAQCESLKDIVEYFK